APVDVAPRRDPTAEREQGREPEELERDDQRERHPVDEIVRRDADEDGERETGAPVHGRIEPPRGPAARERASQKRTGAAHRARSFSRSPVGAAVQPRLFDACGQKSRLDSRSYEEEVLPPQSGGSNPCDQSKNSCSDAPTSRGRPTVAASIE